MRCSAASSAPGPAVANTVLNFAPVRGLLASRMRAEAGKSAPQEHYPAPYALIELWEKHGGDKAAMLAAEKTSFANLMVTPSGAKPDPGVLPARADEEARRQRQQRQSRARHRRRRDGRRYRGMVRRSGSAGDACRHEAGADRRRGEARRRSVRQDHAQAHRVPRRAGPACPRSRWRGRAQRRPDH